MRKDVVTRLRLYRANSLTNAIEIETFLGPVNVSDGIGKEITINIITPVIHNNKTFYTDSNGLEMQERILNYRETWDVSITQPVSGNYYPVNSAIFIQDPISNKRMT